MMILHTGRGAAQSAISLTHHHGTLQALSNPSVYSATRTWRLYSTGPPGADKASIIPNPRIHVRTTQSRPHEWDKYRWSMVDLRNIKSVKELLDVFNPNCVFEKEYWKYTWTERKFFTLMWYGVVIPSWLLCLGIVVYIQALTPDDTSGFPKSVRKHLRKAIYWSKYKRDDERAMHYFHLTFKAIADLNLDPFSDPVMGVNLFMIKYLGVLEKYSQARQIYEARKRAVLEWINNMSDLVDRGIINKWGDTEIDQASIEHLLPSIDGENPWARRTRLLKWLIVMSAEMGAQYHGTHCTEKMQQEGLEIIEWALTEALKENKRRFEEGVKPMEQDWLSADQIANIYTTMANAYHFTHDDSYSIPLYFKSLQLCKGHCNQALIMSYLATAFYNWDPTSAKVTPKLVAVQAVLPASDIAALPTNRREADAAAMNWSKIAQRHVYIAGVVTELEENCQKAFITAKLLQGELLWDDGKYKAARKCWAAARDTAGLAGFDTELEEAQKQLWRNIPKGK